MPYGQGGVVCTLPPWKSAEEMDCWDASGAASQDHCLQAMVSMLQGTVFCKGHSASSTVTCKRMKTILTTPTPHICRQKICPQNMPCNGGPYGIKVPKKKVFLRKIWHTDPKLWHTHPTAMPCDPSFYCGWGWSSICWTDGKTAPAHNEMLAMGAWPFRGATRATTCWHTQEDEWAKGICLYCIHSPSPPTRSGATLACTGPFFSRVTIFPPERVFIGGFTNLPYKIRVATPADLRSEAIFYSVQMLGGDKLLESAGEIFLSSKRGAFFFFGGGNVFGSFFGCVCTFFKRFFRIEFVQTCHPYYKRQETL